MFGWVKIPRATCMGSNTFKSWLFPKVAPLDSSIPMILNFTPRILMVLFKGFSFSKRLFKKSGPIRHTLVLF